MPVPSADIQDPNISPLRIINPRTLSITRGWRKGEPSEIRDYALFSATLLKPYCAFVCRIGGVIDEFGGVDVVPTYSLLDCSVLGAMGRRTGILCLLKRVRGAVADWGMP